jgi:hypothetical protein
LGTKQLLQKKGTEQLEMMPQKRIPEAALSVHVCKPKYRSQGHSPKRWKAIVGKRTNYLLLYDICTLGMVKNFVLKKKAFCIAG